MDNASKAILLLMSRRIAAASSSYPASMNLVRIAAIAAILVSIRRATAPLLSLAIAREQLA
jgi:hypothetical protein